MFKVYKKPRVIPGNVSHYPLRCAKSKHKEISMTGITKKKKKH